MRILHTSDWHLGKMLEGISRLDEQRKFVDELVHICNEEKVELVLVAGDIYDTYNPSAAAEELFYDAVHRLNNNGTRPVIVIAGNHDNPERLCAASPIAYKDGIILLGYPNSDPSEFKMSTPEIQMIKAGPAWMELAIKGIDYHVVIAALAYPSEARLDELLSESIHEEELQRAYSDRIGVILSELTQHFRADTVNVVMSHMFMYGGKESESERTLQIGGAMTVDAGVMPDSAQYVALGHLHRPQRISNESTCVRYSGSPLAYSFSEAGYSKAVYVADIIPRQHVGRQCIEDTEYEKVGDGVYIKEVILNCGNPLKRWKAVNGIEEALEWCRNERDKGAFIDLEIHTTRPLMLEEQKELRRLSPGIVNIRPIVRLESDGDMASDTENRENKKIDELFAEFYKFKTNMNISDDILTMFIETLNDGESNDGTDSTENEDVLTGGEAYQTDIS